VNAAKYNGVDDMRALIDQVIMPPLVEDKTVLVLDEAHLLTTQAQSALLKPFEEPEDHLYIILCTTDPQKLRTEVRGRGKLLQFKKQTPEVMIKYAIETKYR
jgi:DNA polymerase-3 subunit gamma/tau